jgi:hypothetical protein
MSKTLFLLSNNDVYANNGPLSYQVADGIWRASQHIADALISAGLDADTALIDVTKPAAELVVYLDTTLITIDAQHVFITGTWMPIEIVQQVLAIPIHAGRTFVLQLQSDLPFLMSDVKSMRIISQYLQAGFAVATGSAQMFSTLKTIAASLYVSETQIIYLPACYPTVFGSVPTYVDGPILNVGCFGATRQLRNTLTQAVIARRFADYLGKSLRFHTSFSEVATVETENVADLLLMLGAEHVVHAWEDQATFNSTVAGMDVCLAATFSDTFSFVSADATSAGISILVSGEVSWAHPAYANPHSIDDCLEKLKLIWANKSFYITSNRARLADFAKHSKDYWVRYISG